LDGLDLVDACILSDGSELLVKGHYAFLVFVYGNSPVAVTACSYWRQL